MQYEHRGYHHAPQTLPPFNVLNMCTTTATSRPSDDLCQLDAVSTDLTVLGPNSDVEEEEDFFGVETHCRRMPQRGGIRNSAVPSSFHRKHFSTDRIRPELFSMDEIHAQRVQALNWRFQQDLANCGGVLNGGRCPWEVPPPPQCIQPQRRKNKTNQNPPLQSVPDYPAPLNPEIKAPGKSRRRGRRGSRGKRHQSEIPNNEVPILEKGFENELAQQMANHVSNKSALTPNFSSLRLHVAGGGTMIIHNDQELLNEHPELLKDHTSDLAITPTGVNEYNNNNTIKEKTTSPSLQRSESKKESLDFHLSQKISHPKGCGAFFPPQVLKQLQDEASGKTTPPLSSNFEGISLFSPRSGIEEEGGLRSSMSPAKTSMDLSFTNPDQTDEFFQELRKESAGTGCFLPGYLQEQDPDFEEAPDGVLQQHAFTKSGDSSIFVDENAQGFILSKDLSAEGEEYGLEASKTAGDLIGIVEAHDFTTFTSPLHLEEALGDLPSHKTVQEETEQRLINLQIENEELKNTMNEKSKLQSQMESLLTMNQLLQSLLYIERNKSNKKTWYQDFTPIGLSLDRSFSIPAAPVKPMTDQGIQVEDKKTSTGKTTTPNSSNSTKGHTRSVSSLAGDGRTAGKDSMKTTPGNLTAKRTSGLNLVEKSKDSKLQSDNTEKDRQDDAQTKSQRQPTNQITAVKSIDGVPLSNKKATQNRCGEAQNENSAKKKKPGSNLTSKTRSLVKKTSTITRTSRS